jgi:hypothetical protein
MADAMLAGLAATLVACQLEELEPKLTMLNF